MTRNGVTQISRARHYSTFNISNIADTVLYVITKDEEATMTGRNVQLSNLLIRSCLISVLEDLEHLLKRYPVMHRKLSHKIICIRHRNY